MDSMTENGARQVESGGGACPRVSVLIPCRNEVSGIEACVRGALEQEGVGGDLEVVVIDGASDDGTAAVLERMASEEPRLRVLSNPRSIVSVAMNLGVRAARGEILIRMDAHTEYAPDYVRECVEALERTGAENVGGPARTRAEGYWERVIAAAYHSPFAVGGARFHDVAFEGYVDTVPYGCWRRATLDRFGLFDEELVRNQDDEHNLRITRGGGRIWQTPRIRSWYRPRPSLRGLFRQYSQYGYWKVRVIRKHRVPASWRHLVPGVFVLGLVGLPLVAAGCWGVAGLVGGSEGWLGRGAVWLVSLWAALVGLYLITSCGASIVAAVRGAGPAGWGMPLAFAHYHIGYGWGFLRGLWDAWFRGAGGGGSENFRRLTR
jgi:GT2 family glycosyltransferase